jgi:hypothetical protein
VCAVWEEEERAGHNAPTSHTRDHLESLTSGGSLATSFLPPCHCVRERIEAIFLSLMGPKINLFDLDLLDLKRIGSFLPSIYCLVLSNYRPNISPIPFLLRVYTIKTCIFETKTISKY